MNMIIAAIPAPAGERRPARKRDGNGAVPHGAGRDFALGDDKLVALDDLISQRQRVWIDGEGPINVGKSFGLETHVALLRIRSQLGGMAQRNDIVSMSICQAHSGRYGEPGSLVGNPALNSVGCWRR